MQQRILRFFRLDFSAGKVGRRHIRARMAVKPDRAQMQESGLPFSRDSIFTGYSTEEELYTALLHRIRSGARIDGVAARNDTLACIAMAAVQECGLRVPDDVSVVGFDNARISRIITPHLTTVEIDRPDMARAIIDMLDAKISGEPTDDFHFSTKLIERDSV